MEMPDEVGYFSNAKPGDEAHESFRSGNKSQIESPNKHRRPDEDAISDGVSRGSQLSIKSQEKINEIFKED